MSQAPDDAAQEGPGLFAQSRPEIATDDWDDQDLLTKDEARLRLEESAEVLRQELREASVAAVAEELRGRIARIDRVLEQLAKPGPRWLSTPAD